MLGDVYKRQFDNVVLVREVHRVYRGHEGMTERERAEYVAEAERFLDVTGKMAECTWTSQDHAWLARRNRNKLKDTPAGRAELAAFDEAPLLMDGRKRRVTNIEGGGEDGADQMNDFELTRLASRTGKPIVSLRSYHELSLIHI